MRVSCWRSDGCGVGLTVVSDVDVTEVVGGAAGGLKQSGDEFAGRWKTVKVVE